MDVIPCHLMSVAELWTMTHTNREAFSFHLTCMNIMSSHCIAGLWLRSKKSGSCYAYVHDVGYVHDVVQMWEM